MKILVADPKDQTRKVIPYSDDDFTLDNNIIYLRTPFSHCILAMEIKNKDLIDIITKYKIGHIAED